MQEHEKGKVIAALGGKNGIIDVALPSVIFLLYFNISHSLSAASISAIVTALVLAIIRLIRKDTLKHVLIGLVGVIFSAFFAWKTGSAKNYFAPSLWKNTGFALFYVAGNLMKWPIIGVILGPILGENFEWRKDPARLRIYILAGWVWIALFVIRLAVQLPLFHLGYLNALGIANIFLGLPLYFLTLWATWALISSVPTTKPAQTN